MFIILSTLLSLCLTAFGDECVTYNFEENLEDFFTSTRSCSSLPLWNAALYNSTSIVAPHESSATFLTPNPTLSCVSSSTFVLDLEGTLEVNVYMDSVDVTDQITVLVQVVNTGGTDLVIAQGGLASANGALVSTGGFQTLDIESTGFPLIGAHEAYLVFIGIAAEDSTVVIDSYRYISPGYGVGLCPIYQDKEPTTPFTTTVITVDEATLVQTTDSSIEETDGQGTTDVDIEDLITLPTQVLSTTTEDGYDVTVTDSTVFTDDPMQTEEIKEIEESTEVTAPLSTSETDQILTTDIKTEDGSDVTISESTLTTALGSNETFSTGEITRTTQRPESTFITSSQIDFDTPNLPTDTTTDSADISNGTIFTESDDDSTQSVITTTLDLGEQSTIDSGIESTITSITDLSIFTTDLTTITDNTFTQLTTDTSATNELTSFPSSITDEITAEITPIEEENEITAGIVYTTEVTISTIDDDTAPIETLTTDDNHDDNTTFSSNSSITETVMSGTENGDSDSTLTDSTISYTDGDNGNITAIEVQMTTENTIGENMKTTESADVTDVYATEETENQPSFSDSTGQVVTGINTEEYTETAASAQSTIGNGGSTTDPTVFTTHSYMATEENDTENKVTDSNEIESPPIATDYPDSTQKPIEINARSGFWNPLAVTTVAVLICIALVLVLWCFYACGLRKGRLNQPIALVSDYDSLPRPIIMPRPKSSYASSFTKSWLAKNYV